MLLQAAGNFAYLTQTCCAENFLHEREASSLSRHGCFHSGSSKISKKHHHGRGTHCCLSSNAHFAHQYGNHFTCLCKTHTRRYALCLCTEVHRIPTGLHQARKHSLRRTTVAVVAVKTPSNQDPSQQGEASKQGSSMVYKPAMVSAKGVKVEGLEDKTVIINGNTNMASSEKVDSEAFGSRKPTKQLTGGIKDLKNWWKTLNEVYQADSAMWGYGSSAIFTVYEGPDSKIEKVSIDEKEIQRRQGVEPLLPGFGDDETKARAEQKIMLAQSIAKDLEMGKIDLDRHSTIFTVVKHPSKAENQTGRQKLLRQIDFAVHKAAPVLRSVFMIAIPLYGICILFGAYLLVTKGSEEDLSKDEKSAASLEKMRKLKAQMNTHKESAGVGQATLAPSDFMQKLLEVREMARKVRSEEGLQKSVKDSDTDVEEYQPQEQSAPNNSILMVENAVGTEQGGIEHKDIIDTTVIEFSVPTMDNMAVIKSNNNVIDVIVKPPPKVKPRIITSLDEAMAVLGSKQTVIPNGIKSNPDINGTLSETETQAEHELGIPSKVHYDNLTALSNGLNNSQSSAPETLPSKVDQIPSTSLGGQDRVGETESSQSREIEVPHGGAHLRPNKTDTGTLDRFATEGRTKEAQSFEPEFQRGSDESQDSDKTASLHRLSENVENVPANEKQISSSTRPSEVNNLAQKPFKNASDQISGEVLPSARSKTFLKKYSASKSVLNVDTDDVVGSGQPLRKRETRSTSSEPMSNTKRWSKEIQRKYDLERDPEARELIKEIGSELDSWVTEEEVEEVSRLASKLEEADDDVIRKHYEKVQKKIKGEKEKFGLEAVLEKYKEYQPKPEDEWWWLDLRCVMCLMVVSAKQEGGGLYGLDMTIDSEGLSNQVARHIIAFEDRKDASNFCRLLELRSGSRFQFAQVCPFSPKKLFEISKEEGFKVTVLRNGQIQTNIDQTLEEVEEQILEIGRSVYWEKMDRDHSIDIDSILHQRFGL